MRALLALLVVVGLAVAAVAEPDMRGAVAVFAVVFAVVFVVRAVIRAVTRVVVDEVRRR